MWKIWLMICVCIILNSCIFKVQQIPNEDSQEGGKEEKIYVLEFKIENKEEKYDNDVNKKLNEYNLLMKIFNKKEQLIIKAFEKNGQDPFIIARLLKESKVKTLEEFIEWLKNELYKEYATNSEILDREIFNEIHMNYNLLEEMEDL
ncbi:hypothetical protein LCGC14_0434800 [marine sediment metagenome]|uniref:Uncharacterized protein n=1 Tax=marine sediment metagenome TaxID=412755 RepID=A0A0F9VWA9_9ZZZZ